MFNFLKTHIKKLYTAFTSKIASLFSQPTLDEAFFTELFTILISADTGISLSKHLVAELRNYAAANRLTQPRDVQKKFEELLYGILTKTPVSTHEPRVLLMVGINGSGKTTTCAKLAHLYQKQGKRPLLVAADTFRAAAVQQLQEWGNRLGITVMVGKEEQDPASVVFSAAQKYLDEQYDYLIIDTAGRLQTKINLMRELEKIGRIIEKKLPHERISRWLTIDAMLGQNSLEQARLFHQATTLDGIVLTKVDGTGKGGTAFAIAHELALPVTYLTFGEKVEDIKKFDAHAFVHDLLTGI